MNSRFFNNHALATSTLIGMAMLVPEVPNWVSIFCVCLTVYKIFEEFYRIQPLPRWVVSILAVLMFAQIYLQYRTFLDQIASASLLLNLTAIKVLDFRNERDHKFIFLLGFILLALKTIFSFDLIWLPPIFISFVGLWLSRQSPNIKAKKAFFIRQTSMALPLGIILFIAFPRFILPWAEKRSMREGHVGFSDQIDPGTIASISLSSLDVLTARFRDDLDFSQDTLYWRGAILDTTTGFGWKKSSKVHKFHAQEPITESKGLAYEVALDPQASSSIFTLEKTEEVHSAGNNILTNGYYAYKLELPPKKTIYYEGRYIKFEQDSSPPQEEDLQLPEFSQGLQNWLNKIAKINRSPEERLQALKMLFSDGSFTYTNKPGSYDSNELEEFVFRRRTGFCEHFAAAYAALARGLDIPARVVVGFQGGAFNKYGRFWKVTTRDAHAWVEVFIAGKWTRIDPTSWIAPLRLELGSEAFFNLPEDQQRLTDKGQILDPGKNLWHFSVQTISAYFENLNFQWTEFLLSFNGESQQTIMLKLKYYFAQITAILLGLIFSLSIGLYFLRKRKLGPPDDYIYDEMVNLGTRFGLQHELDETPLAYMKKFASRFPIASKFSDDFAKFYESIKYSKDGELQLPHLKLMLSEWKKTKDSIKQ